MEKRIDSTTLEEFKTFFKHLAFVACAAKAPVRQMMLQKTLDIITKAGATENIERWSWWTPAQLSLMQLADQLTRVILIGGNGTGKTVMLDSFAMKTAKENPDEKVIFAIHQTSESARSLLQLDLEVKYEKAKLSNVTVVTFKELSGLTDVNFSNVTVCVDEISMEYLKTEDLNAIQAKSLWMVIRETDQFWLRNENPEEYLRTQFPDWVIVNLSYPLSTSKRLSDQVKRGKIYHKSHTNSFNRSLQMAPNMPLGPEPLILPRSQGSYQARLQQTFSAVGNDMPALIIVKYDHMQPTPEEIQSANSTTTYQELAEKTDRESQNLLVAIEAVKACQRPHGPPLLWFRSENTSISHGKDSIKERMKGKNKTFSGRDIITDNRCVAGYESDFVIYVGSSNVSAYMSRCRGQFVRIE